MSIKIRISNSDDVEGIRQVQKKTWLVTYPNESLGISRDSIVEKFAHDNEPQGKQKLERQKLRYLLTDRQVWVAEKIDDKTEAKKIIGFCTALREGETNRLAAIYVDPDYQHQGLGTQMVKELLSWLGDEKDILVNVVSYNQPAINFYQKFGFKKTGREGILDDGAVLPSGEIIPELEMRREASIF